MDIARKTALGALLKVDSGDGYSNIVLDETLKRSAFSAADSAFISALFYGTLERRITLDWCISRYLGRKIRISPYVREALRLGAYQILFMDRVPVSAAVNESVSLVKQSAEYRAAGLVNAILRKICDNKVSLLNIDESTPENVSVKYSVPLWLVKNLISDYGEQNALDFCKASLEPPPVYIRVNTLKTTAPELKSALTAQGISVSDTPLATALRLDRPGSVEGNPLFMQGLFFVEDLASQICVAVLSPNPGEDVLDLCAAPGGKSFAAALLMENTGRLVSCDLYPGRCSLISDGAKRLGINIIETICNDSAAMPPDGLFDKVLCDVPCSGFGIIRRKPDIRYKDPDSLKGLVPIQTAILENGAAAVKPGGRLVYSTCTLRKSENQKVADRFLAAHPEFEREDIAAPVKSVTDDGCLTLMPQYGGTDGFFIASFKRRK